MNIYQISGAVSYSLFLFNNHKYHIYGDIHNIPLDFISDYSYIDNDFKKVVNSNYNYHLDFFFQRIIEQCYYNKTNLDLFLESPMNKNYFFQSYNEIIQNKVGYKINSFIKRIRNYQSPLSWMRVLFYPFLNQEDMKYQPYVNFYNLDIRYTESDLVYNPIALIIDYITKTLTPLVNPNEIEDINDIYIIYIFSFIYLF